MIVGLSNKRVNTNMVLDWLWENEDLIDKPMRAESKDVYDFIATQSPIVAIEGNGYLNTDPNLEPGLNIHGAVLGIHLYTLSNINAQGQMTCMNIKKIHPVYPVLYVIRTITNKKYQNKGVATLVKKELIEYARSIKFGSIWGHHEQGSTMQHINIKLGAEEIMTEPSGWNGSDKTHILYRITL